MFERYYYVDFHFTRRFRFNLMFSSLVKLIRIKFGENRYDSQINKGEEGILLQSANLIENTPRSNYTRERRHNIRISDSGTAEWGIWEEHMQIKLARIVRYGKVLGKICIEIRIKICAPILCAAFGSDPNPRWPSAEDRLLRNYTTIPGVENKTIILLLYSHSNIAQEYMSGRTYRVTWRVWKRGCRKYFSLDVDLFCNLIEFFVCLIFS